MSDNKPDRKSNRIKTWLREPLVHFLAIGALIFLSFHLWSGGGPGTNRIVITPGQVDSMEARFTRTWQRSPTEQELKGLIDDYVRGEIAAREARALGLDRDDTIIQRRLRQKLEFLAEDAFNAQPPTEAELQVWLDRHPDPFRIESKIAFRQVYLNPDRRGESIAGDAEKMLQQLSAVGPAVDIGHLGDALMLPQEVSLSSRSEVSRLFGRRFTDTILSLEAGHWSGPIRSTYGLHLVFVRERTAGRMPGLAEIRPLVEREFLAQRRKRELEAMYERLLERYHVTMQERAGQGGSANAATADERGRVK
ncbi:MAG: peptidylprolyl isomerase [Desulfobacterales bacterium]